MTEYTPAQIQAARDEQARRRALRQQPQPQTSIGEDITHSFLGFPKYAANIAQALPREVGGALHQSLGRSLKNIGTGLEKTATLPYDFLAQGSKYLKSKDILPFELPSIPEHDLFGLGAPQAGDTLWQMVVPGGLYSKIQKGLSGAKKLGATVGLPATFAGAQGENPIQAAMGGVVLEGLGQIPKVIETSKPSNIFRGTLSPEELKHNLKITQGTTTALGDVINNPVLKRLLENKFANIPFSGATEAMQKTASQVLDQGKNLIKQMSKGIAPEYTEIILQKALQDAFKTTRNEKNAKFAEVNELAAKENVTTERNSLRDKANAILKQIESDPDLATFRTQSDLNLLKNLSQTKGAKTITSPIISSQTGKPIKIDFTKPAYSLKETDFLRAELGDRARDAFAANDKVKGQLYKDLQQELIQDINSAIDFYGSPKLKDLRNDAMKYYRSDFAPFEDPQILKFLHYGADPDVLLQSFLKTSRISDRSHLLNKLMSKLPQNQKSLVPLAYYQRAIKDGEFNPLAFRTLHKNLGTNQKKILLPDEKTRLALDNYSDLVGKNIEPLTLMFNPKTGQRNLDFLAQLAGSGLGSVIGGSLGGMPGVLLGNIAGAVLPGVASRPIVKRLTSPQYREKLINAMLKKSTKATKANKQ